MDTQLLDDIRQCTLCAPRFAATETAHDPRPVAWFHPGAPILIAGQAPGMKVHLSGKPFDDPSGDRLRDWMGLTAQQFYDREVVSIVPMSFCFPGYRKGADLPPPAICAKTWHSKVMAHLGQTRLTLLVGGYAHKYHLKSKLTVTDQVQAWRDHAPDVFPLPHPSWRNTAWLKRNPWFEDDLLPPLRTKVQEIIDDRTNTA